MIIQERRKDLIELMGRTIYFVVQSSEILLHFALNF